MSKAAVCRVRWVGRTIFHRACVPRLGAVRLPFDRTGIVARVKGGATADDTFRRSPEHQARLAALIAAQMWKVRADSRGRRVA